MKPWEKIIIALDDPRRDLRARAMFELMEEERASAIQDYKSYRFEGDVKLEVNKRLKDLKEIKSDTKEKVNE